MKSAGTPGSPTVQCVRRLQKEFREISQEPPPLCIAATSSTSILVWYFVLKGAPDTPYEGGAYVGKLCFPSNYPMGPPELSILTPSGRFEVGKPICLSMSNYHPEEWSPMWTVRSVLIGLLSFMTSDEATSGSVQCDAAERRRLARLSRRYNVEKLAVYKELFRSEYDKDLELLNKESQDGSGDRSDGKGCRDTVDTAVGLQGDFFGSKAQFFPIVAAIFVIVVFVVGLLLPKQGPVGKVPTRSRT